MEYNGAEILVKSLLNEGVDTIFGFPGGAILNIYDELYKYSDKIKHILTCHEQGASHAADGYARASGKVGVCLATSGPGATNLVTGIATAYMDSVPMVAITGNVAKNLLGKDSFQEVDIVGITMPITKHNYIVDDVNDLEEIIHEAFKIAREGRPGPVLIDIPKNITATMIEFKDIKQLPIAKRKISKSKIEEAIKIINESKEPFIYAGGGVISSGASKELLKFCEKINSPISLSLMGQGTIPKNHRLYTGMIGMHGTKASNIGAIESDLVIAIGSRFSDRVVGNLDHFQKNTQILHIDIDDAEIDKNVKTHHSIIGDVKEVLEILNDKIDEKNNEVWLERINDLNKNPIFSDKENFNIKPTNFFETLNNVTGGEDIICTEVGQHQMWTSQYYNFKNPRQFITSGGLGTMGYGLGASIGAQIANPDKRVFNIAGDGSFMMNCNEITTIASYNLPIVMIVLNNSALGMVRQWQHLFYDNRFSSTILKRGTDFVKLAESQGVKGFRVEKLEDLESTLKKAYNLKESVLIDVIIEDTENVYPMVAPGKPIDNIITEPIANNI